MTLEERNKLRKLTDDFDTIQNELQRHRKNMKEIETILTGNHPYLRLQLSNDNSHRYINLDDNLSIAVLNFIKQYYSNFENIAEKKLKEIKTESEETK